VIINVGLKVMKIKEVQLIVLTVLSINITPSLASTLQVIDDANWGANSIIYDPTTGLDWLKPINTANMSFNFINSQLGSGNYSGFSYASYSLLGEMLTDAGLPLLNTSAVYLNDWYLHYLGSRDQSIITLTNSLMDKFELTGRFNTPYLHNIVAGYSIDNNQTYLSRIDSQFYYGNEINIEIGKQKGGGYYFDEDTGIPWVGSWLVRTHTTPVSQIPEPASMVLLTSGLIGIVVSRRRKYMPR